MRTLMIAAAVFLLSMVPALAQEVPKPQAETPEKKESPKSEEKPAEKPAETPKTAEIDKAAPDFTLKNARGEEVKLASFKGKFVVLEWVNFDCPYVRKHYDAKDMVTLQKKYREKEVVWLQICSSAKGKQGHFEGDALKERIAKEGCDEAFYLLDEDGAVGGAYKARTTPAMYVIDKEGVLRYMGAIDSIRSAKQEDVAQAANYVSAALEELLAGKAVTTRETKSYG